MMENQLKLIALRIKDLREIEEISTESLSKKLGISNEEYLLFESGEKDIPVGILFELANYYGVELTEIMSGDNPKLSTYCLVRKNKGISIQRQKAYNYESLAFNFTHKKLEPFMVTVEYNDNQEKEANTHPGQEFNYVIEGTLEITINDKKLILEEGDSIYFDSQAKHKMKACNGKSAKFLAIIA